MNFTKKDASLLLRDNDRVIPGMGTKKWIELWKNFLDETQKWDGKQLAIVYGENYETQFERKQLNKIPNIEEKYWDTADERLIGEFLRRNHARIAYETAILGMPSQPSFLNLTQFFNDKDEHIPTIAGAVSHSHGVSVREALLYFEPYSAREIKSLHPTYLVALLRIADSMHLHSERAPGGKNAIQKRTSPMSKREYSAHQAIIDVRLNTEPDPEAICIEVIPSKLLQVQTYFRIQEWVTTLQNELDNTWAILGEIYGRYELSNLWLKIRRVNTNLNNQHLQSLLTFYPIRASFGTGNSNFLNLLIEPLYGNDPNIGIRELLQNAIDAVREHYFLKQELNFEKEYKFAVIDRKSSNADVVVNFCTRDNIYDETCNLPENWKYWVEISDRGVGMSSQTVTEYFLKAGSTFRNSDYWKKNFLETSGDAKILRSGRFGVGALAAFLIGDQIQVTTRHFSEESGIQFVAGIDDEFIQFDKTKAEVGTCIKVKCEKKTIEKLIEEYNRYFRWYYLSWPKLIIKIGNSYLYPHEEDELKKDEDNDDLPFLVIPGQDEILPPEWRRIRCKEFSDIHWRYENYSKHLYCNGIIIPIGEDGIVWKELKEKRYNWREYRREYGLLVPDIPTISVFDPNGNLNLNLARNALTTDSLPFSKALLRSIFKDIIAHSLVFGPSQYGKSKEFLKLKESTYPGFKEIPRHQTTQWLYLKNGFTLADPNLLHILELERIIVMVTKTNQRWLPSYKCNDREGILLFRDEMDRDSVGSDCLWPIGSLIVLLC
jgi:hypothetical protein